MIDKYTHDEIRQIFEGYKLLDTNGKFSRLLKEVASCKRCEEKYPSRSDLPVNALVRPLPLSEFVTPKIMDNYRIRITRDDTLLRNLLQQHLPVSTIRNEMNSAKFAIGLLPWLDRCMLFRSTADTTLMVLGIDYKHFPIVCQQRNDQNFPLDSYREKNNIWNQTWRNFWSHLLGIPYDDGAVNTFMKEYGVYMTNSMLCFGGSTNPGDHHFPYLETCREYIEEQLRIVRPRILLSFGNDGCHNAAAILLKYNPKNTILQELLHESRPLTRLETLLKTTPSLRQGIPVTYDSFSLAFWAVYQPARASNRYIGDYEVLKTILANNT